MTNLSNPVHRVTSAKRHEKSQTRAIVLSLEPPAAVGVRLKGTHQTYRLDAEVIYELAVRHHSKRIEKRAKELQRSERLVWRGAVAKATKELLADLK